jgi:hypothetical protein
MSRIGWRMSRIGRRTSRIDWGTKQDRLHGGQ